MRTLFLMLVTLCLSTFTYANSPSPVGYWKTIDDVTGQPKSVIKIWEDTNHRLEGTVVKIFSEVNTKHHKLCAACDGDLHNKPILGMTILTNLKLDEDEWTHGRILDPTSGKIYKCNVHTLAQGSKLHVRGYIGLPILGRSQTWIRVDDHSVA